MPFSIRLPNTAKIECSLAPTDSSSVCTWLLSFNDVNLLCVGHSQVLYEIAFAHYSGSAAFSLCTLRPRFKLPIGRPIGSVKLEPRTALILEQDDEALDPLTYLSMESEVI